MATLESHFTFENFVVGPANRLASAAARRASERPGVGYNPLFIHAPAGMGKTHVLGAIAHHVEQVSPDKKVEYQTAQEFLDEFVGESGVADAEKVRKRYRDLDILLLDEVHLITAQPGFQDFLLRTIDALAEEGKQVVLTSTHPPSELDGLGALLRTRFEGGLEVDIGPPEYETRVAIIRKWLEIRLAVMQPGVPDAMGRIPFPSVKALDDAFHRILALQDKEDRTLSPEEVAGILETSPPEEDDSGGTELGQFLDELSDTVAAKVEAQETPWRKALREVAEVAEENGFKASGLRRYIKGETPPSDVEGVVEAFHGSIESLKEIQAQLDAVGNPWPEAAHGILKDPEQLKEAEALLAAAEERARPFPKVPPGPKLKELGGVLPKLTVQAADQLVSTDRSEYNPLYVWSRDGMAARALLHAAGRSTGKEEGVYRVALTAADAFAEEFVRSLSTGVAGAWRERWWMADLFLMDSAQDLSETERAQEELFHLLEAIQRRGARIMFAADRPPGEISALDDRLRARLEEGLVVEIEVEGTALSPGLLDSLQKPEPEIPPEAEVPGEGDVATEDREWIKSFQPGGPRGYEISRGPTTLEEESLSGSEPEGEVRPLKRWIPSREQVILEWTRFEERIVEDLD